MLHKVVTGTGAMHYDLTEIQSSLTSISGTATGNPDPYSFVSCSTESFVENDSGATTDTLGTVNDFSYADDSSNAYEYTLSGPTASTITDLSTTTESSSGTPQDSSNGTLIPAYWNTYANALATSMGTSPLDAPIQDGTTSGEWDTSQGLASAIGGQDMHALQFTGAEVQPALSGSAVALEQGGGGSGVWASHPSAIGYRRQGYTTGGSHGGSGSGTITRREVERVRYAVETVDAVQASAIPPKRPRSPSAQRVDGLCKPTPGTAAPTTASGVPSPGWGGIVQPGVSTPERRSRHRLRFLRALGGRHRTDDDRTDRTRQRRGSFNHERDEIHERNGKIT